MSKEEHYEERKRLYNQFKTDNPQTIGETDKAFDNDNFIDWLVDNQNTKPLVDEIAELKNRIVYWNELHSESINETVKYKNRISELEDLVINLTEQRDLKGREQDRYTRLYLESEAKLKASKSEANEAVESQEDILRELISLIQTSSSVGIIMQKFTITRNNK